MTMAKLNNAQIKEALTDLRNALRAGHQRVGMENPNALQTIVGIALRSFLFRDIVVLDEELFSGKWMHPTTAARFLSFFTEAPVTRVAPDDVAWALQNFINRRSDPWAFWYRKTGSGTDAITSFQSV